MAVKNLSDSDPDLSGSAPALVFGALPQPEISQTVAIKHAAKQVFPVLILLFSVGRTTPNVARSVGIGKAFDTGFPPQEG